MKNQDFLNEKQIMRFSKKVMIFVFCHITLFAVIMTVIFCIKGFVPDTLIIEHYRYFSIESGALSIIKISENIIQKFIERNKENEKPQSQIHQP